MGVVIRYYIKGPGHMTKMPATSKYGQILSRFFFAEVRLPWNLAGNIDNVYRIDNSGLTLTYLMLWSNLDIRKNAKKSFSGKIFI